MSDQRFFWGAIAAMWLAIFAAYSNSFTISFQFDDTHTVQANLYVRSLKYIPRYFVDATTFSYRPENSGYRPMTTTALALGFALSKTETWGYHLIKLIEQCLVATLLALVALRLLPRSGALGEIRRGREIVALLAGLVFGVHRASTEVVDYISAVSTLQAGLFYILAFYLYLRWRESAAAWRLALSVLCYFLGMLSKEEAITLPAMLFAYELIYGRKGGETYRAHLMANIKKWMLWISPYAAAAVLFVILRAVIQPAVADTSRGSTPVFIYFITQFRSWLHYWKLFFWPVTLNADNLAFDFSKGLDDWRVWASLAVHVAAWTGAWIYGKKRRFVLFAVAWMYVTILPASSFFPLVEAVNEHRMYIPYLFLSLLSVWGLFELAVKSKGKAAFKPAVALVLALSILLGAGAYARNEIWQTDVSLWEDVLEKNPESPRAMNVLGISLMNRNEFERSVRLLERCHLIAQKYLPCIVHLSLAYAHFKRYQQGLGILKFGHDVDPNYVHVNFHLGVYYKDYFADYDSARKHLERAYEVSGGRFFQATLKLAEMELEEGRIKEGLNVANSVLQIDLSNGDAWEVFGKAHLLAGNWNEAKTIFERLNQTVPNSNRYLLELANFAERTSQLTNARDIFRAAAELYPNLIQAWIGLERVCGRIGEAACAAQARDKAAELTRSGAWEYLPSMFLVGEKPKQIKPL